MRHLITFFALAALAFAQERPLDCVWPCALAHFGHLKWPTFSEFS